MGDPHIDLITNVPETVDAVTLAALYRKRWKLETAFQHLEAHLESDIEMLAYPRAALFAFCLALVAYNVFSMRLAAMDAVHSENVSDTMSTYYLGHEIASTPGPFFTHHAGRVVVLEPLLLYCIRSVVAPDRAWHQCDKIQETFTQH